MASRSVGVVVAALAITVSVTAGGVAVADTASPPATASPSASPATEVPEVTVELDDADEQADDPTATATATVFGTLTCAVSQKGPDALEVSWAWNGTQTDRVDVYLDPNVIKGQILPPTSSVLVPGLTAGTYSFTVRGALANGTDPKISAQCNGTVVQPDPTISCTLASKTNPKAASGFDRAKTVLTTTWSVSNADSVTVEWLLGGVPVGSSAIQTVSSGSSETTVGPYLAPEKTATSVVTAVKGAKTATKDCGSAKAYALPSADITKITSVTVQPDRQSAVTNLEWNNGVNGGTVGIGNLGFGDRPGKPGIFNLTVSPSTFTCPARQPIPVTVTAIPTAAFASFYGSITRTYTVLPDCQDYQATLYAPGALSPGGSVQLFFNLSLVANPSATASADFIDWRGTTVASAPFAVGAGGSKVFAATVPTAVDPRCLKEVRLGGVTDLPLATSPKPIPGPYNEAADKAYCEQKFPLSPTTGGSTTSGGGASSAGSGSATGATPATPGSVAKPASTGSGGASSASVGSAPSGTSQSPGGAPVGGPGAAAEVKVHSAPCLADGVLYADMAGSVGSSFVMAPDLRNRPVPASFAVTSGSLPAGMALDTTAGVVFGVPTQADAGSTPITITATNPDGSTVASTFSFPVDDPHHSVSYPVRVVAGLNEPVDVYPHGKGNSGPASYSLVCGTMPSGLALDPRTGIIAGTPTIQVQYPIPLRVRQVDEHGWVDASMMLLVDGSTNPWLSYPHHVTVATGINRTIRPTVVGLPDATYELAGTLPKGMNLDPATGAIIGRPQAVSKKPAEVTVSAVLPDGTIAASDTLQITVRKRAIPMAVTAAPASRILKPGSTAIVVAKVKHTDASRLVAKVVCADCTHTFDATTGRVTVRPGADTTSVRVTVTATPVGSAARAKYRSHTWTRTWSVR